MLFKFFILTTSIKVISCVNLTNGLKGQSTKNQRKLLPFNSNTTNSSNSINNNFISSPSVSNIVTDTDKTKTTYTNGFPDVIYPTCILDNQPFYFSVNGFDVDLGPFSNDVKSSYKDICSNNKKNKQNLNLLKTQENGNMKHISQPNPSICQEIITKNQEGNDKLFFKELKEAAKNNISIFDQDDVSKDISQTSSSYVSNNIASVIEEYGKYNYSLFNICNDVTHVECEDITNNISTLARNETLNQICKTKNALFEKSIIDEHQKQTQGNCSVEDIWICTEDQLNISHQSNNTYSNELLSLIGESSKENEILYPLLQLFNHTFLEDNFCNTMDNHDSLKKIVTYCDHGKNKTQTSDFKDFNENDEDECLLDLIISLANLCQTNDTSTANHSVFK